METEKTFLLFILIFVCFLWGVLCANVQILFVFVFLISVYFCVPIFKFCLFFFLRANIQILFVFAFFACVCFCALTFKFFWGGGCAPTFKFCLLLRFLFVFIFVRHHSNFVCFSSAIIQINMAKLFLLKTKGFNLDSTSFYSVFFELHKFAQKRKKRDEK